MEEPDLCQEVYQLYAGPDLVPAEKLDEESLRSINMKRIDNIIKYNAFGPRDSWQIYKDVGETSLLNKDPGTGLWILPSYFNHSCASERYGDCD